MSSDDRSIDIDDCKSISKQSCFDWGLSRDTLISTDGGSLVPGERSSDSASKGPSREPSSRYDPKAMSRIVDITDLVDEADSDDEEVIGHSSGIGGVTRKNSGGQRSYGPGGSFIARQALILLALVAIIVAASLAIGFAVPSSALSSGGGSAEGNEQALFETAERVIIACSESALNEDMKACQKICKRNMCCFETGTYSCKTDEKKMCAAYAGCEALVEGIPTGAAEEDEE
mmetsp:Transcript_30906/g.52395  ORF Transcript_30906/g.52395 Transcript_30906/m.52395 type:complete len:231 (-) Transcript_30906:424-1116(-)